MFRAQLQIALSGSSNMPPNRGVSGLGSSLGDDAESAESLEEVVIAGLSSGYEVVVNGDPTTATTDKKLRLVYEKQKITMELRKNDGSAIDTANIIWQVQTGFLGLRKETTSGMLVKELVTTDKDVTVKIYERIKDENGKEKKAKIAEFEFVIKQSPYITFSTLSSYDGEFGFDNGEDFKENSKPKRDNHYDKLVVPVKKNEQKAIYAPWLTLLYGKSATLKVSVSKVIDGDSIYVESSTSNLTVTYNRMFNQLIITNNALSNTFANPDYIFFYRNDKYGLQRRMLIGKVAVVGMNRKPNIDVRVVYYAKDITKIRNKIELTRLENLLNNNSLNQTSASFRVLSSEILMKDTLKSYQKTTSQIAYASIKKDCELKGYIETRNIRPNVIYVVITEMEFSGGDEGLYLGGGVQNKNNLAVMWQVPGVKSSEQYKSIVHEVGHTLGLFDVFKDETLGNPEKKFSRSNYMDYFIERKMFFKTQMESIFELLTNK